MKTVVSVRRLFLAAGKMASPAALALVPSGRLRAFVVLAGVAALAGIVAINALLLRPVLRDIGDLARYAREIARGDEEPAPPHPQTDVVEEAISALSQFRRAWRASIEDMAARVHFHETLFDTLPSPFFLLDGQRRIVGENLSARKIFGRQQRGRDLAALLRHPDLLENADLVIAGGGGRDVEFAVPGPLECQYRAMIVPLEQMAADGTVAVLSLHDITAMKRVEQMRADFVANASHELRTPLATVLGFIETLRGPARDDTEAREKFLGIMQDQATRMSRLVADLLTLSRIELHEHSRPDGDADLALILPRIAAGLEHRAAERKMRIDVALEEPFPTVLGEENELEQVFQNLIDNALKYGREGTTVTVSGKVVATPPLAMSERRGPVVAISVRDQGEGIAREHLPRLTERFFRIDTARSRQLGGTGLGLAIAKHVVNRHRGALVIDSQVGEGSCFTVFLPMPTLGASALAS